VAWPGGVCAVLVHVLRMAQQGAPPSGRQPGLLRAVVASRPGTAGQVGGHRPRSARQARTASVSVRGRTRKTPGAYGRTADRARRSHDR
jgi:hypothetical protein